MSKYPKHFPPPPPRQQCVTARRLAMLKRLCKGVVDATTRKMVQRCKRAWWGPGEVGRHDVKLGRG